jgi:hypothetical protein
MAAVMDDADDDKFARLPAGLADKRRGSVLATAPRFSPRHKTAGSRNMLSGCEGSLQLPGMFFEKIEVMLFVDSAAVGRAAGRNGYNS